MKHYHCFWKSHYIDIGDNLIFKFLSDRERAVIKCRYGIGVPYMTLRAIGKLFNINGEQVRQCEARALRKMRHRVNRKKYSFTEGVRKED